MFNAYCGSRASIDDWLSIELQIVNIAIE